MAFLPWRLLWKHLHPLWSWPRGPCICHTRGSSGLTVLCDIAMPSLSYGKSLGFFTELLRDPHQAQLPGAPCVMPRVRCQGDSPFRLSSPSIQSLEALHSQSSALPGSSATTTPLCLGAEHTPVSGISSPLHLLFHGPKNYYFLPRVRISTLGNSKVKNYPAY